MDIQVITQVISTLGFPIACVIYMAWREYKHEQADKEEREKTNNMILEFSKNIQENSMLLQNLADLIKNNKGEQ